MYDHNRNPISDWDIAFNNFMSIMTILFLIVLVIGLVIYLLRSISWMRVMRQLDYKYAWMAWLPIFRSWALADVASDGFTLDFFGARVPKLLFQLSGLYWMIICIPIIGVTLFVPLNIIMMGTVYANVYAKREGKLVNSTLGLGIISGLLPIVAIIKFLMYNKKFWTS